MHTYLTKSIKIVILIKPLKKLFAIKPHGQASASSQVLPASLIFFSIFTLNASLMASLTSASLSTGEQSLFRVLDSTSRPASCQAFLDWQYLRWFWQKLLTEQQTKMGFFMDFVISIEIVHGFLISLHWLSYRSVTSTILLFTTLIQIPSPTNTIPI